MPWVDVFSELPEVLLPWYRDHKRELPWRADKNPYHIWISEIMLQQTRVEAVKGYYHRFLKELPNIEALANVDDDSLNKLWEGLGYYTRARNLKKAAQRIVSDHNGHFPDNYSDVIALPGIGDYTAGAICSIAFDQPTPAVDGNVLRVVARILGDPTPVELPDFKKQIHVNLASAYPKEAGEFTQALMELGATVCIPNGKPSCEVCPCNGFCSAFKDQLTDVLPVRLPKRERRTESLTVYILNCDGRYAVERRPKKGLLAGLWQFPNIPDIKTGQIALDALEKLGIKPRELLKTVDREHIFTHIKWEMRGVYVDVKEENDKYLWVTAEKLEREIALPTAFRQFWIIREDDQNG